MNRLLYHLSSESQQHQELFPEVVPDEAVDEEVGAGAEDPCTE